MTGPLRPEDVDGFFAEADGRDASESESPRTEPCAARITNGAHVRVTPEIQITAKLRENTDEAIAALRADDNLYQRDGRLVHITRITREESERSPEAVVGGRVRRALVEGSPQIRELALATLTAVSACTISPTEVPT